MDVGDHMKLYGMETNQVILKELGHRIQTRRIALSITQTELAKESGVSLRTIINVENGKNVSLNHLISLLRSLHMVENLDSLIPEMKSSPLDILSLGGPRQRASRKKGVKPSPWKWGDES
jgi:transcriptional regulator with XRE-family HTH domain